MEKPDRTVLIVFISLVLDLLAFTMILPLLPSLLEYYRINDTSGLYSWLLTKVHYFQTVFAVPDRFSTVLFGGFLGSLFSFLQFVASPVFGSLSDVYGRKSVLLLCLIGIAVSYVLWVFSTNLAIFVVARIVGGLSKGNVSLCMAIITDVSSVKTRGRGMALVGIAFSLGFIIGPIIGALFAAWAKERSGDWFIAPALFALFLATANLVFMAVFLDESLPKAKRSDFRRSAASAAALIDLRKLFGFKAVTGLKQADEQQIKTLGYIYFIYLFIYSGLEFTLTFLTHHVFGYTSMQQGWMFFAIGLIMATLQGSFVRRVPPAKTKKTAELGLWLIVPSFACIGMAENKTLLYLGVVLFAVSTAMVVPCMTTLASHYGTARQKGTVMGIFRSLGALARAVGPIFASIAFWTFGSKITYLFGAVGLLCPVLMLRYAI